MFQAPPPTLTEKRHTILFLQPSAKNPESRTWADYDSMSQCLEGICKIYEEHLKRAHPDRPSITYNVDNLFDFIKSMGNICCLEFDPNHQMYMPRNAQWIQEHIYLQLRLQADQSR
ncbi:hypothetical protein Ciccas_004405 [Cichlidogyrus casuarinus]|uniref:Enhancer of rudimentary homolog n=1 Tax=Cichlidogyrus casuarinus TaxID=1844966 RepID=A0ABD2QF38_9PLAT